MIGLSGVNLSSCMLCVHLQNTLSFKSILYVEFNFSCLQPWFDSCHKQWLHSITWDRVWWSPTQTREFPPGTLVSFHTDNPLMQTSVQKPL